MYPLELFPGPTIPLSRLWRSDDGDDGDVDDDDDDDDSTMVMMLKCRWWNSCRW